jgi:hypothetical protein
MGSKVKCSLTVIENIAKSNAPTIICNLSKRYLNNVLELSNETISLNLRLAQNLLKFQVDERADVVQNEVMNILTENRSSLLIKDFEMLFDPRYKIDVVKLISEVSRLRKVIAMWPGTISENNLVYANTESPDYQVCNINNYDIICVY